LGATALSAVAELAHASRDWGSKPGGCGTSHGGIPLVVSLAALALAAGLALRLIVPWSISLVAELDGFLRGLDRAANQEQRAQTEERLFQASWPFSGFNTKISNPLGGWKVTWLW
jgi:hypothetical protein